MLAQAASASGPGLSELGARGVAGAGDEVVVYHAALDADGADTGEHRDHRDQPTLGGEGELVAAAGRGDGGDARSDGSFGGADVAGGARSEIKIEREDDVTKRNVTRTTVTPLRLLFLKYDPLSRWIERTPRPIRMILRTPTKRLQRTGSKSGMLAGRTILAPPHQRAF
ncbi:MAG: hypothetical protein CK538_03660 [Opitutia bacterium]|nr:MAG: hypothetical protein CK538_03660 [Opitutae bacterium]